MTDNRITRCLKESEIDTIEVALREKANKLISEGEIEQAEIVEQTIKSLDKSVVCDNDENRDDFHKSMPEYSRSMRFGN